MNTFKIDSIKPGTVFGSDLLIDTTFIIEPANIEISGDVLNALREWEFVEVTSEGNFGSDDSAEKNDTIVSGDELAETSETISNGIKRSLENAERSRILKDSEISRLATVQKVYNEYMTYTNYVYTHYATHNEIDQKELSSTMQSLCVFIRENRRYVLRITPSSEIYGKNYLVEHAMRSTVLAITIGLQLHMGLSKLVELGAACLLHEIGMIRLPPHLYLANKQLSQSERGQMSMHPVVGYEIVRALKFPLPIQLGILEHHEKENGLGYPRHLTGDRISIYAKIIAVTCSFEAIIAPRNYKPERSAFDAMVEMLKNENHQYDETVIKALLYSISLFPIGAYVYLVNGSIGQVVDVHPDNPKTPIVQILDKKDTDGSPKIVQTNNSDMRIVRVLSKEELADVMKSLQAIENTCAIHAVN